MPPRSAPMKPIARSTSSTGIENSLASTGWTSIRPSRRVTLTDRPCSAANRPAPSSLKRSVMTEKARSPPSSCADETRKICGHSGQGLPASREAGGRGSSSNWCTDCAPCRSAVPRQSAPVSPPPMITTRLPAAEMIGASPRRVPRTQAVLLREVLHGEMDAGQFAARHRQIARLAGTAREQHRVVVLTQLTRGQVDADVHAWTELHALGLEQRQAPVEHVLLHLEFRDAVAQQPADPVRLLEDGHLVAGLRRAAAPRPGQPDPTRQSPRASRSSSSAAAARSTLPRRRGPRSPARWS